MYASKKNRFNEFHDSKGLERKCCAGINPPATEPTSIKMVEKNQEEKN